MKKRIRKLLKNYCDSQESTTLRILKANTKSRKDILDIARWYLYVERNPHMADRLINICEEGGESFDDVIQEFDSFHRVSMSLVG